MVKLFIYEKHTNTMYCDECSCDNNPFIDRSWERIINARKEREEKQGE